MKRDFELIRKILLDVEVRAGRVDSQLLAGTDDVADANLSYHYGLLNQANLIDAIDISTSSQQKFIVQGLTWQGAEFLNLARNENAYTEAIYILKEKVGGVPFELLQELLRRKAQEEIATS